MLNALIEAIFSNFSVNGVSIPVCYLDYQGHESTYITYMSYDKDNSYSAEDEIAGYIAYYDFDIYSKTNYYDIVKSVKSLMKEAGWTYQPRRESPDMIERDTGYFHKTLCFAYPVQEVEEIPDDEIIPEPQEVEITNEEENYNEQDN